MIMCEIENAIKEVIENKYKYICFIFDEGKLGYTIVKNEEIFRFYRELIHSGNVFKINNVFGLNSLAELDKKVEEAKTNSYTIGLAFYFCDKKNPNHIRSMTTEDILPCNLNEKTIKREKNKIFSKVLEEEPNMEEITYEEFFKKLYSK